MTLAKAFRNALCATSVVAATFGSAGASTADGDILTHRSLEETKSEVIRRAQQNIYPLLGMNPQDVREAVAGIKTLRRDEWAKAFMAAGDKYMQRADAEVDSDRNQARKDYGTAQKLYYFGRWPAMLGSASREESYRKERAAFMAGAKLSEYTVEEIRAEYDGKVIPGLLALPKNALNTPLVLIVGGLDGWKEARVTQFSKLLDSGVAILSLDAPGTGQSPMKLERGATESLVAVLDKALERKELDGSRVVVYGGSFGGYWATKLAVDIKDRIKGAVDHSGPFDATFHREQFSSVMKGEEYLFDAYPAMFELLRNVRTAQEFFSEFDKQSLAKLGYGNKPTADMFVIGGQLDTLVPTPDLLAVMAMPGGIKEAWINPTGIHMGRDRQRRLLDSDINQTLVFPWILKKLGVNTAK